ncbi:MAG: Serine-type D-Ala-D-Ala carboxypeptidase [Chthoniobacteraceae bacterium]|nr:Serine-type D-Ala-D-Ala carboxypeptidase [Chthoniobacteraceae bacterium]
MIRRCFPLLCFVLTFALGAASPAATKTPVPKKAPVAVKKLVAPKPALEPYAVDPSGKAPRISASSAILLDANTGEVLMEVNADQPRPVASTQKLLTALLVAETGNLSQDVRVETPDTWAEPSMLYIKPGDVYTRQQLLSILLVKSMNDVARCLARDNAGSVEAFAAKMNAKAQLLGMTRSNFVNPNGLPAAGQNSTARDMARVAFAAYRNRTIRSIVCLKSINWEYSDGRRKTFETTNRVLKNYPLCNGMKTGYTEAAGHCLISSASNGTREVISVVLGASKETIWNDSYRLLAWGLSS